MTGTLDFHAIFEQATGRPMLRREADDLRRLRAHMPSGLAESPAYTYDLIVTYHLAQELRNTIAEASRVIRADAQHQSKIVVAEMVENAVKRIHATSPASQAAQYRALTAGAAVLIMATCVKRRSKGTPDWSGPLGPDREA